MTDSVNWLDTDSLTYGQMTELANIMFDNSVATAIHDSGDPRVYILYDHAKQTQLLERLESLD